MGGLRYLVLLAFVVLPGAPGRADPRADVEQALKKQLKGNVLTLQKFYKGDWLRFDAQGNLRDPAEIGAWTLYAMLQVDKVKLSQDVLEIRGHRLFLVYHQKKKHFRRLRSDQQIRIELEMEPGEPNLEQVQAVFDRVFLTGPQQLTDVAPRYWTSFLSVGEERACQFADQAMVGGEKVHQMKKGEVEAPVCVSCRDPEYTDAARRERVQSGLELCGVVSKEGKMIEITIRKPIGLGMDDAAVEAVREWQFKPARKDGEPVAVFLTVEMKFYLYGR